MNFDIRTFFEGMSRKFRFHSNPTRIRRSLHEDLCAVMIICRSIFLRIKNVSDFCLSGGGVSSNVIYTFYSQQIYFFNISV